MNDDERLEPSLISYRMLQRLLGTLGILLPVFMYFGNGIFFDEWQLKTSLSRYYYSGMRDVYVGIIFAYGLFLFAYNGYEEIDKYIGTAGGIFAIVVAIFPTTTENADLELTGIIHVIAAFLFYSVLIVYLFLFRRTDEAHPTTEEKLLRNKIYLVAAIVMIICIIGIVIVTFLIETETILTFVFETVANLAFGTSWLIKSGAFPPLNDS